MLIFRRDDWLFVKSVLSFLIVAHVDLLLFGDASGARKLAMRRFKLFAIIQYSN